MKEVDKEVLTAGSHDVTSVWVPQSATNLLRKVSPPMYRENCLRCLVINPMRNWSLSSVSTTSHLYCFEGSFGIKMQGLPGRQLIRVYPYHIPSAFSKDVLEHAPPTSSHSCAELRNVTVKSF